MSKNLVSNYYSPAFWADVSREVYSTFDALVVPYLEDVVFPEVRQEVQQKYADCSLVLCAGECYHRGYLKEFNGLWFSIHVQIDNREEIEKPGVRIFAILPFVGSTPYVFFVQPEIVMRNQLDVYTPHFLVQYANRAERFSIEAYNLGKELRKFKVYENSNKKRLENKSMKPIHYFLGMFLSQNWLFLTTQDPKALSYEEQTDGTAKKWTMVLTDSVIFGETKTDEDCSFVLNVYLTNVGYDMLGEDQKSVLLPLKEELMRMYMEDFLK